ncbi:MAG: hypothetical protein ACRDS0_28975, partial [Pseudonocardiaceae bacterium]
MLRIQRTAGNAALASLLSVQRSRVNFDRNAEAERRNDPRSEANIAVVYVAEIEQGLNEAVPLQPMWSGRDQKPENHAERKALKAAKDRGYSWDASPYELPLKRVVRVYTELAPCRECEEWLVQLDQRIPVQWTAPPRSDSTHLPNRLWWTRVALLDDLNSLKAQYSGHFIVGSNADQRWNAAREVIVTTPLIREINTEEAALGIAKRWKDAVLLVTQIAQAPAPFAVSSPSPAVVSAPVAAPLPGGGGPRLGGIPAPALGGMGPPVPVP